MTHLTETETQKVGKRIRRNKSSAQCAFREFGKLKLSVKFHDAEMDWLMALAKRDGVSIAEVVRRSVRAAMGEA